VNRLDETWNPGLIPNVLRSWGIVPDALSPNGTDYVTAYFAVDGVLVAADGAVPPAQPGDPLWWPGTESNGITRL
jgi:hypothetical protein